MSGYYIYNADLCGVLIKVADPQVDSVQSFSLECRDGIHCSGESNRPLTSVARV